MFKSFRRHPYKFKSVILYLQVKAPEPRFGSNQILVIVQVLLSPKSDIPLLIFLWPKYVEGGEVTEVRCSEW